MRGIMDDVQHRPKPLGAVGIGLCSPQPAEPRHPLPEVERRHLVRSIATAADHTAAADSVRSRERNNSEKS